MYHVENHNRISFQVCINCGIFPSYLTKTVTKSHYLSNVSYHLFYFRVASVSLIFTRSIWGMHSRTDLTCRPQMIINIWHWHQLLINQERKFTEYKNWPTVRRLECKIHHSYLFGTFSSTVKYQRLFYLTWFS